METKQIDESTPKYSQAEEMLLSALSSAAPVDFRGHKLEEKPVLEEKHDAKTGAAGNDLPTGGVSMEEGKEITL
jgi:hypothetical protein